MEPRTAFAPPFAAQLWGGFTAAAQDRPLQPLEAILRVRLESADDLELGGAYFRYAPDPLPDTGLVGVRLHANEIPGLGLTLPARPDLLRVLLVEFSSRGLLDFGRLVWQLEQAYGDAFAVAEYAVASGGPAEPARVQRLAFTAGGQPASEAPYLTVRLEFELTGLAPAALLDRLAAQRGTASFVTGAQPGGSQDAALAIQLESPSLLELGRCAQAVEDAAGGAARVRRYSVIGDLLRDGTRRRFEDQLKLGP